MLPIECSQCKKSFIPKAINAIYCSKTCRSRAKYLRQSSFRKRRGCMTQYQINKDLRTAKRNALAEMHSYPVGTRVRGNRGLGVILMRLEKGDSIGEGWQRLWDQDPELIEMTPGSLYSTKPLLTPRYLIGIEFAGKIRVVCPYLSNIIGEP